MLSGSPTPTLAIEELWSRYLYKVLRLQNTIYIQRYHATHDRFKAKVSMPSHRRSSVVRQLRFKLADAVVN